MIIPEIDPFHHVPHPAIFPYRFATRINGSQSVARRLAASGTSSTVRSISCDRVPNIHKQPWERAHARSLDVNFIFTKVSFCCSTLNGSGNTHMFDWTALSWLSGLPANSVRNSDHKFSRQTGPWRGGPLRLGKRSLTLHRLQRRRLLGQALRGREVHRNLP